MSSEVGAWQSNINGTANGRDQALAVTVGDAGNVIAAGYITNPDTGSDFTVIKFNGAKGTELWRHLIGNFNASGVANAVTLDGARNVIAAGFITNPGTGSDFTVIKFDGASGAELWRQVINGTANGGDQALAVRADVAGDVVAVGFTRNSDTLDDFTVVKLSGADGTGQWTQAIDSNTTDFFDTANGVTFDRAGNVVAVRLHRE